MALHICPFTSTYLLFSSPLPPIHPSIFKQALTPRFETRKHIKTLLTTWPSQLQSHLSFFSWSLQRVVFMPSLYDLIPQLNALQWILYHHYSSNIGLFSQPIIPSTNPMALSLISPWRLKELAILSYFEFSAFHLNSLLFTCHPQMVLPYSSDWPPFSSCPQAVGSSQAQLLDPCCLSQLSFSSEKSLLTVSMITSKRMTHITGPALIYSSDSYLVSKISTL